MYNILSPKPNLILRALVFCTFRGMTQFLPSITAPLKPMFGCVGCLEEGASDGGSRWAILNKELLFEILL